jgi:hypothetical protein
LPKIYILGFIYDIVNTKLKPYKHYIGCTTRWWKERIHEHFHINNHSKIHQAIKEFGPNCFEVNVIEVIKDQNLFKMIHNLLEREKFWITQKNAFILGYNQTRSSTGFNNEKSLLKR